MEPNSRKVTPKPSHNSANKANLRNNRFLPKYKGTRNANKGTRNAKMQRDIIRLT